MLKRRRRKPYAPPPGRDDINYDALHESCRKMMEIHDALPKSVRVRIQHLDDRCQFQREAAGYSESELHAAIDIAIAEAKTVNSV